MNPDSNHTSQSDSLIKKKKSALYSVIVNNFSFPKFKKKKERLLTNSPEAMTHELQEVQ